MKHILDFFYCLQAIVVSVTYSPFMSPWYLAARLSSMRGRQLPRAIRAK